MDGVIPGYCVLVVMFVVIPHSGMRTCRYNLSPAAEAIGGVVLLNLPF